MAGKLSKAQLDLLTHAVAAGQATCADFYAPRRKLVALGYVTEHETKYGSHIKPTQAGIDALRAHMREHK